MRAVLSRKKRVHVQHHDEGTSEKEREDEDVNARAEKDFNSAELYPAVLVRNFAITEPVSPPLLSYDARKGIGIRRSNRFAEGIKDETGTALLRRPRKRPAQPRNRRKKYRKRFYG